MHILGYAVAADIVDIAAEFIKPVRRRLWRHSVKLRKTSAHLPRPRRESAQERRVKEIARGGVIVDDMALHSVLRKRRQYLGRRKARCRRPRQSRGALSPISGYRQCKLPPRLSVLFQDRSSQAHLYKLSYLLQKAAALMADIQHMAFPRAKHSFYARAEFRQHIQRHESLKRTGEAPP